MCYIYIHPKSFNQLSIAHTQYKHNQTKQNKNDFFGDNQTAICDIKKEKRLCLLLISFN